MLPGMASPSSTLLKNDFTFKKWLHFLHFQYNSPNFSKNVRNSVNGLPCQITPPSQITLILSCLFPAVYLFKISQIFPLLTIHTNHHLSSGVITSELNYCNNLQIDLPISNLIFIQSIFHNVIRNTFLLKKINLIMWLHIWNSSQWSLDPLIYDGSIYLLL